MPERNDNNFELIINRNRRKLCRPNQSKPYHQNSIIWENSTPFQIFGECSRDYKVKANKMV